MVGILISKEEHEEYKMLKAKNTPMKKVKSWKPIPLSYM